jgi:hypothetical protein
MMGFNGRWKAIGNTTGKPWDMDVMGFIWICTVKAQNTSYKSVKSPH